MKARVLFVFVAASLLLSASTAAPTTAYYGADRFQGWVRTFDRVVTAEFFTDARPGLVTLTDQGFETTYDGLITISGTCTLKYNGVETWRVRIAGFRVIETSDAVASFSLTIPARPVMPMVAVASSSAPMLCNVLFEAVE